MDVVHAEAAEGQLEVMIMRRVRKGDVDPDEREEIWKASVRAYNARRQAEMRTAWREYHTERAASLRRNLEALAEGHEQAAEKLMEDEPKGERNGQGEIRQRLQGAGGNTSAYEIP